jgi:pimeloyl-ACP methyl ester carboxylesterase
LILPHRSILVGMVVTLLMAAALAGCSLPARLTAPERYGRGVVFVLPGIEGRSVWNRNIALGLDSGGVEAAIEVFDWTSGVPGGMLYNLMDLERNRRVARQLADRIVAQRTRHPNAPIHLVGHSGGGGMILLTLEALPPGRQIDSAVLLAAAVSPDYNLVNALRRARYGIVNFYSEHDAGFLVVGTSLFGSIDRYSGPSAGAVGFRMPDYLVPEDQALYKDKLRQVAWDPRLKQTGNRGGHFGWTSQEFVRTYVATIFKRQAVDYRWRRADAPPTPRGVRSR